MRSVKNPSITSRRDTALIAAICAAPANLRVEPFFELFERRDVGVGSQPKSKQSRLRRTPKIQLPGRVAVDQSLAQEIIQD
jgi:hypothetical protein